MKIDRTKNKKIASELPTDCRLLIERLKTASDEELLIELKKIESWTFGKCELYHWIDVLDRLDSILAKAVAREKEGSWVLACDMPQNKQLKELLLWTLHFTTLLIEHSFSRHLYNSMEYLADLLSSTCLVVVLGVLNLLYMFSKRSNFIWRLPPTRRQTLLTRLTHLAESWGGKENGFGIAECCKEQPISNFPSSATALHFEFHIENQNEPKKPGRNVVIHVDNVDKIKVSPAEFMTELIETFNVPESKQMQLFTLLRLSYSFSDYRKRLQCVQARLQALSVLVYSNSLGENVHTLLYPGLLEELVDVLEMNEMQLMEIRAAALRTLTSIIHLDRNPNVPKFNTIVDVTGAGSYHGFLPVMVRSCIASLTKPDSELQPFPLPLATALFSFLYHLASYEAGGDALVNCGIIESLLRVVQWHGTELEHITFVTRAVRVIDLITNLDFTAFQAHSGHNIFIQRLESEVNICRKEQPFEIYVPSTTNQSLSSQTEDQAMEVDQPSSSDSAAISHLETKPKTSVVCLPQRAALLKSMLNFLKKAVADSGFSDSVRHLMEGSLPSSLKHIISNAEYYGSSLFLLATDVVTVYVFHEPSLLSSLQDSGLTDVLLQALLVKDVPVTREVLASLPNVFSALCLNSRGLEAFVACKPFEKLFKVFVSPEYLPAMRRRRGSDPLGDTAATLGSAMDELMRHQPSLRGDATGAIIKLLEELCTLGRDPTYTPKETATVGNVDSPAEANQSSDEEEDDDEGPRAEPQQKPPSATPEKVPLVDYVTNVMKFIDAILSNNSTDDHCREFVTQNGLDPLMSILSLPNLPLDFPSSTACQSVSSVCKSILNLAHEAQVLKVGLSHLQKTIEVLSPLTSYTSESGSYLLHEISLMDNPSEANRDPKSTPILHAISATHSFITMFIHVCRTSQADIRLAAITQWASSLGVGVLKQLSKLYTGLVWESTILLSVVSDESIPTGALADLERLLSVARKNEDSNEGVTAALEALKTASPGPSMDVDAEDTPSRKRPSIAQLRLVKPLLSSTSKLGRSLAELFGLLVKLCIGSPVRPRRSPLLPVPRSVPTPSALAVSSILGQLLSSGLAWEPTNIDTQWNESKSKAYVKTRLTYLICYVGFTQSMLLDDKKLIYHLILKKFIESGGLRHLFNAVDWVLTFDFETPELSESIGEFLDAWFTLIERLCNPKSLFDSPHTVPEEPSSNFTPLKYIITIHKLAVGVALKVWSRKVCTTYAARVTDSLLSILCHVLNGEATIKEKLSPRAAVPVEEGSSQPTPAANPAPRSEEPIIDPIHLTCLMEMGFERSECIEALLCTSSLEQATEFLLNFSNAPSRNSNAALESDNATVPETPSLLPPQPAKEDEAVILTLEPLDYGSMHEFSPDILPNCLQTIESLPDTVFRVCDFLVALVNRANQSFKATVLDTVLLRINEAIDKIEQIMGSSSDVDHVVKELIDNPASLSLSTKVHLCTLLIDEFKSDSAQSIARSGTLDRLVSLLKNSQQFLHQTKVEKPLPKWMAPLLLMIDEYSKVVVAASRRELMKKVVSHDWKWYDVVSGKWCTYTKPNNDIIDKAFWDGETSVKITAGRRRYVIQFTAMVQINEETSNRRPVMICLKNKKSEDLQAKTPGDMVNFESMEVDADENLSPLNIEQGLIIVRSCVGLMVPSIDGDTLHAVLRLCLRLTREYEHSFLFVDLGGMKKLLDLTQISTFHGFISLATLLIRHLLEDQASLRYAMEKTVAASVSVNAVATREINFLLRVFASAACRDSNMFADVAKSTLTLDVPMTFRRGEEEEPRLVVKANPNKPISPVPVLSETGRQVLYSLLNALILEPEEAAVTLQAEPIPSKEPKPHGWQQRQQVLRNPSAIDLLNQASEEIPDSSKEKKKETKEDESLKKKQHLLSKSIICRLLGELVRSYAGCSKVITEYSFQAGASPLVTEDCSAIAFILDNLLPSTQTAGDKDCPAHVKLFLGAIASCSHTPDAQNILIVEIKNALQRALALQESSDKHTRIQAIANLISSILESSASQKENRGMATPPNNNTPLVKVMIKRGIVSELARASYCLDLSSPNLAATVNAVLKPLEFLTRVVNIPVPSPLARSQGPQAAANVSEPTPQTTEGDAQAEAHPGEDTERTENDLSTTNDPIVEDAENVLEEIMDTILDRGRSDPESQVLGEVHMSDSQMENLDHEDDTSDSEGSQIDEHDDEDEEENADEGDEENDEENIDEQDDEASENEDNGDNDDEGGSAMEEESNDYQQAAEDSFLRHVENDDYLMIHTLGDHDNLATLSSALGGFIFNDPSNIRALQLNLHSFDDATSAAPESIGAPAPRFTPFTHPLLSDRQAAAQASAQESQGTVIARHRMSRTRNRPSQRPNTSVIIQRLLGPSANQDLVQLDASQVLGLGRESRFLFIDTVFGGQEDDHFEVRDQGGGMFGSSVGISNSGQTPSTLGRWLEEAFVMDASSIHDCLTIVKPSIMEHIEEQKDKELAERKEKRRKQLEEEEAKKRQEREKKEKQEEQKVSESSQQGDVQNATMNLAQSMVESVLDSILSRDQENENAEVSSTPDTVEFHPESESSRDLTVLTPSEEQQVPGISEVAAVSQGQDITIQNAEQQQPPSPAVEPEGTETPLNALMNLCSAQPAMPERQRAPETEMVVEPLPNLPSNVQSAALAPPQPSATEIPPEIQAILGDLVVPEGVDPSFLAALPEEMRQEVINEHNRMQRLQGRTPRSVNDIPSSASNVEVNPEFLAALPPSIQEEVLTQQRLEQQRIVPALVPSSAASTDQPEDSAGFLQSLPTSLRQTVLADLEDSQIALLPPDLAAEAQRLRREWEARNRHLNERIFSSDASALNSILRSTVRLAGARYAIQAMPSSRSGWTAWGSRGATATTSSQAAYQPKPKGKQLLDVDGLTCLLVLLFLDEPKLNIARLHRVIRNLCYHNQTRQWVIKSLLLILEKINQQKEDTCLKKKAQLPATKEAGVFWLNISMDAALGSKTSVFSIIRPATGKKAPGVEKTNILVHPQAAPTVCRHVLDVIIQLAKTFPETFLPKEETDEKAEKTPKGKKSDTVPSFWDVLLRLDTSASKKGKSGAKIQPGFISTLTNESEQCVTTFETSPFGQLFSMLSMPVVKRSALLTDRMLKALSLVSLGLPGSIAPSSRRQEGRMRDWERREIQKQEAAKETSKAQTVLLNGALEPSLRLAVGVLTSKSCSEEGLEDATSLLMNLSHASKCDLILNLLLDGARELGCVIRDQIQSLLNELRSVQSVKANVGEKMEEVPEEPSSSKSYKGVMVDRFTRDNVVLSAPSKPKALAVPTSELQLSSMTPLTTKGSNQAFFLRILKVVLQLKEAKSSKVQQPVAEADRGGQTETSTETNITNEEAPMEVDNEPETSTPIPPEVPQKSLSEQLDLDELWITLSNCLELLSETPDSHAVLILQPTVEAFFLVHGSAAKNKKEELAPAELQEPPSPLPIGSTDLPTPVPKEANLSPEVQKFLSFAEKHRTVLNQILRQSSCNLTDGPFAVLVDHTRVLDFDVKRRFFRSELEKADEGHRREDLAVHVRREHVFQDSFRELHRRNAEEWKHRFYIVFEGEEGQDAGGLLREWYVIISREIFNPMYALFKISPGDRVTYMINESSHYNPNHLQYFKFVGRVIAKAIYDNKLLECYFTRSFYKHILGKHVKYTDMETEDYSFYQGLVFLMEHDIAELGYELTFSTEVQEFGVTEIRDLKPNGRNITVTEENKMEYVRLVCQMKMTGAIRKQLDAFLEGFYDIIPKRLISIFNEQELELLISGLPNVDVEDLRANTEYHKYQVNSLQIQWFWRALRSFDQADRAKFLQFVTGTSKVPLQGFAALEGMNGTQKFQIHRDDRSTDRLPSAHTCFNQLDLPAYETYDKLREYLLKAIRECSEGFGFA
ncbi:E3 ubiquitin-protein ligase HUWE1-like [Artemia franciscana]|uniref:HECT-type E3 ubiquitin transferase n=1 Tax=Artemia franciscana TaxID=6661 RepID=A0AA88H946_ARTSF|nr:hypothetical protein QYM36_015415 [Artemia franciscana]KAK2707711.1 hypothetical protein QYM36_015415 [Artemia franciscana]